MGMIFKDGKPLSAGKAGKEAYKSAHEAGYAGTVAEFVDSLDTTNETLSATIGIAWVGSSAPYTQEIAVTAVNGIGVKAVDNPIISIDTGSYGTIPRELEIAWSMITRIETIEGGIRVHCYNMKPSVGIPIKIKVVR